MIEAQRQTYRAYDFGKLHFLVLALLGSGALAYGLEWLRGRFQIEVPRRNTDSTFTSMEATAKFVGEHPAIVVLSHLRASSRGS